MFNSVSSNKKQLLLSFALSLMTLSIIGAVIVGVTTRKESTDDESKAATAAALTGRYNNEFKETTTALTTPALYFNGNHEVQVSAKPANVTSSGNTYTFSGKSAAIFANPLKSEKFYKISVTLVDTNAKEVVAYLTGSDSLWGNKTAPVNGISAGLNSPTNPASYYIDTSERLVRLATLSTTKEAIVTPDANEPYKYYPSQKEMADLYWSRFIKRHAHDVLLELYVTPIGTYAVIDKFNTFTFPNDYAGRPVLSAGPINYITIGKWDAAGGPVTFKNPTVTKLDANVGDIDEVNAYFIKKAYRETYPVAKQQMANGSLSWNQALIMAMLLRGYDYYFASPGANRAEAQNFLKYALPRLKSHVDANLPRYNIANFGKNSVMNTCVKERPSAAVIHDKYWTFCTDKGKTAAGKAAGYGERAIDVNHSLINQLSGTTLTLLGVQDYLDPALSEEFRKVLAPVIDASTNHIFPKSPDGSYNPEYFMFEATGDWYQGDTAMEEYGWLIQLYSGYYGLYYYDNDPTTQRASKILEWLIFLDHHGFAEKRQSLATAFGSSFTWKHLPPPALSFTTQTVWPDGKIDNHDFHQSVNYGIPSASDYSRIILKRVGELKLPSVRTNQRKILDNSFKAGLDVRTLRRKAGTVQRLRDPDDTVARTSYTKDIVPMESASSPRAGLAADFYGTGTPSLLEDWGNSFISYHIPLMQEDYSFATEMARNVYYSQYNSTGRFFCTHGAVQPSDSTCLKNDALSNFYDAPLFAMMFNPSSLYPVWPDIANNTVSAASAAIPGSVATPLGLTASANGTTFAKSIEVPPTGSITLKAAVALGGNAEVSINGATPKIVVFKNGSATLPASTLGGVKQYTIKVRPAFDAKYASYRTANATGYPWSSTVTITVKAATATAKPVTPAPKPVTPAPKPVTPAPTPTAKDITYTQQLYRELTGTIPASTDTAFKANATRVMNNDCARVVKEISLLSSFQQRKTSYSDTAFATMMLRAIINRHPSDADAKAWANTLTNKSQTRDNLAAKLYTFPEAQAACKERRVISAVVPSPSPTSKPTTPTAVPIPQPDLTLTQVRKKAADGKYKTRIVTTKSQADASLGTPAVLGKIFSTSAATRLAVHECYFADWDEYIIMTSASATRPSTFCPNTTAGWREVYKGVIGYVEKSKTTVMTKPLKECYDETNLNHHYATSDPACTAYANGLTPKPVTRESWVYGWIQ